jgi:hypothetical protein
MIGVHELRKLSGQDTSASHRSAAEKCLLRIFILYLLVLMTANTPSVVLAHIEDICVLTCTPDVHHSV